MSTLLEYYNDLQKWENITPEVLVSLWNQTECNDIEAGFSQAISASSIIGNSVPIRPGSTNQSIGNQVEKYLIRIVSPYMSSFWIDECSGPGYPDKTLIARSTSKKYPLEFKATSQWNPSDSNRRVLTSSSAKVRRYFTEPINHLLATVIYDNVGGSCKVQNLRLDFLEPNTEVNVRLEASVNHKILSQGSHCNVTL